MKIPKDAKVEGKQGAERSQRDKTNRDMVELGVAATILLAVLLIQLLILHSQGLTHPTAQATTPVSTPARHPPR